jgi:hypothetical protein
VRQRIDEMRRQKRKTETCAQPKQCNKRRNGKKKERKKKKSLSLPLPSSLLQLQFGVRIPLSTLGLDGEASETSARG